MVGVRVRCGQGSVWSEFVDVGNQIRQYLRLGRRRDAVAEVDDMARSLAAFFNDAAGFSEADLFRREQDGGVDVALDCCGP